MRQKTIIITLLFLCGQICWAQDTDSVLTEDIVITFEIRAKQKVDDFLSYLSQIGNKEVSESRKDVAVKNALNLFIGKGRKFNYEDEWGNKKEHAPVMIQVTNKYGRKYPPKPIKTYLDNLRLLRYKDATVERANVFRIGDITQINDSCYRAVAYYTEKFSGKTEEGHSYLNFVQRKLFVFLEKSDLPASIPTLDGEINQAWIVKLGDIVAVETH